MASTSSSEVQKSSRLNENLRKPTVVENCRSLIRANNLLQKAKDEGLHASFLVNYRRARDQLHQMVNSDLAQFEEIRSKSKDVTMTVDDDHTATASRSEDRTETVSSMGSEKDGETDSSSPLADEPDQGGLRSFRSAYDTPPPTGLLPPRLAAPRLKSPSSILRWFQSCAAAHDDEDDVSAFVCEVSQGPALGPSSDGDRT